MINTFVTKVRKYIIFLLIASIVAGASYLIVYKGSFVPNGYEIVAVQKDSISLKSFNMVGIEKGVTTISFSEYDNWKIDAIDYEVIRQKEFLWLLFITVTLSIILFIYKVRHKMNVWKAIFESNIIISALPLYNIITSLNRIRDLIS